jgi:glutamate racemase
MTLHKSGPIGVFDSGVGGLSVWQVVTNLLPHEDTLYFADTIHCPYGARPMDEIRAFAEDAIRFLLAQRAKIIVVACNAASAAALTHLRLTFPHVPIVGMEPAVKPAAEQTRRGKIGVLATHNTLQGELIQQTIARHASGVEVHLAAGTGLVELVEAGQVDGPAVTALLRQHLEPMLEAGVDVLALGCTHYAFLRGAIEQLMGPDVLVIDPAPAVARQVTRVLESRSLLASRRRLGQHRFYTSGDPGAFEVLLKRLPGVTCSAQVFGVS